MFIIMFVGDREIDGTVYVSEGQLDIVDLVNMD